MTKEQPATGPGLRIVPKDCSPDAVKARIAQFCAWFGVEPVKLKVRAGKVYMTDDLLGWVIDNGASLDWIIGGDPIVMMAICRDALLRDTIAKVEERRAQTAVGAKTKQDEHAACPPRLSPRSDATAGRPSHTGGGRSREGGGGKIVRALCILDSLPRGTSRIFIF